jgi:3-deoxy-manno-octulosonate cytidylyltransferase (CMP-KDO synthetase)
MSASPSEVLVIVPARMGATRLPGKPLADIHGTPMIVHVLRRAQSAGIGRVVVATDTAGIASVVIAAGGEAVLTGAEHASGSDRVFEALTILDPDERVKIVFNLQGDLPDIAPEAIRAALVPLADPEVDISTVAAEIVDVRQRTDPNVVKVVGTEVAPGRLRALYFTRASAPHGDGALYHHIGLYAFRRVALARFVQLPPSRLERRERLEQLRALEAGMRIDVALVDAIPVSVDTPADLDQARAALRDSS